MQSDVKKHRVIRIYKRKQKIIKVLIYKLKYIGTILEIEGNQIFSSSFTQNINLYFLIVMKNQ